MSILSIMHHVRLQGLSLNMHGLGEPWTRDGTRSIRESFELMMFIVALCLNRVQPI